jgi:hypothetical protein
MHVFNHYRVKSISRSDGGPMTELENVTTPLPLVSRVRIPDCVAVDL